MEARRFGFVASTPPANKFDPTDEDIVAYYLLPRAVGLPNPYAHAVIDDDPYGCPPWELLRRHGHAGSDEAFFFVPPRETSGKAGRVSRVVGPAAPGGGGGGVWRGQKGEDKALVIVRDEGPGGAAELTVRFRRYNLAYHRKGDRRSSGWVMHEYHVVDPVLRPGAVVARVKITEKGKKMAKKEQRLQEEDAVVARTAADRVPEADQPDPSGCFVSESDYGHAAGNASSAASPRSVVVDGEGFGNSYDFSEGFGNSYDFSEGFGSIYDYFNEGEGSGDNFLQKDGGCFNFLEDDGGNGD